MMITIGKVSDVCSTKPCANNGICMQTPMSPSMYKCRCEGTGYYGSRCEYRKFKFSIGSFEAN